uniref:uncharacterized protein LOC120342002 n=1 Tax=Styela clava TaxID=7725 RepID=UPI001939B9AC|nr:uncharacterized protein LOC120342002 [Styela clava]XP_039267435.1 uncharacterized protein LOC120342594 [Styela clava]
MASKTELTYRLLTDEDLDEVIKFIQTHFIPFEPLSAAANVKAEEEKEFPRILIKNSLWQAASIGAFDNSTGELCAVRVNSLGKNNDRLVPEDESMSTAKMHKVQRILRAIKGGMLKNVVGTENYMEHIFVSVNQAYAKRGIATELYRRSELLANQHGCKKLIAICSNSYTRRSTEKIGYKLINEIKYDNYIDEVTGEKPFANMKTPHSTISLVVKTL